MSYVQNKSPGENYMYISTVSKNELISENKKILEKYPLGECKWTMFIERQYSLLLSMSRDVTLEGGKAGLWWLFIHFAV